MDTRRSPKCWMVWWGLMVGMLLWFGCSHTPREAAIPETETVPAEETATFEEIAEPAPMDEDLTETTSVLDSPLGYVHTVQWRGETLSLIAKWYTGKLANWTQLAAYNPNLNPHVIYIGNQVRIPQNLLTTRDPMPQSFVSPSEPTLRASEEPSPPATETPVKSQLTTTEGLTEKIVEAPLEEPSPQSAVTDSENAQSTEQPEKSEAPLFGPRD